MESMVFFFLENMALIIALMFLALKGKELLLLNIKSPFMWLWLSSFFIGFLTFSVMYNSLDYEGMHLDLREVPLYFISYVGGWKLGIISSIFPSFYRFHLGGPTALHGILLSILLPVLIGALFHNKKTFNPTLNIISIKRMMIGLVIFEIIKSFLMIWTTPATLSITIAMFFFAFIAVLAMGLMLNDAHQNIISRRELEYQSNRDSMTNLPNIRYFNRKVENLIYQKKPIAISMFDIDYFKSYNDTHGHQKGDLLLRTLGQLLTDSVSKEDFIARYGGDEFIICFSNVSNPEDVTNATNLFLKNVEEYNFEGEETQPGGKLTISMGVSFSSENQTLEQIIEETDSALYHSKKHGRNQITIYGL
ncbi:diguanylate cyclase [Paenisporosarcina sp. TG20]|uniref:GGDEF domain-containing protein n=1 Tax=Paenisporosarcina sp. TG20 TaxID=1211706 RepID=UPI000307AC15|nr:diguanylate cyclase [Paenisporosarcina sp. TG20]